MEETFICQNDPGKKGLKENEKDKRRKKLMCSPRSIVCPNCAIKRCRDNELPVVAKLYARDVRTVLMKCHEAEACTSIP
jgi:hypothetical protein